MTTARRTPIQHFPALDGVRGIAILLVLAVHAFYATSPDGWARATLLYVPKLGWSGVDLFFVLSGFLITTGLLHARGARHARRNFFARRALRLLPLYYLFLLAWFGVVMHLPAAQKLVGKHDDLSGALPWFLFHTQNLWYAVRGGFSARPLTPLWSLAIEEQFYLVWPFVILSLSRRAARRLCWSVVIGVAVLRMGLLAFELASPVTVMVLMPTRADTLCGGALLALLYADSDASLWQRARQWAPRLMGAAALTLLSIEVLTGKTWNRDPVMQAFGFPALLAFYAALLVMAISAPPTSRLARGLGHGSLRALGRYSYAIYLFHTPLNMVLEPMVDRYLRLAQWPIARAAVCLALIVPLSLAVGALSWKLIESPILRLKGRLPMTPPPAELPAGEKTADGRLAA